MPIGNSVQNQLGAPAIWESILASFPPAGYTGRLLVATDTFALYRDNGTGFDLIGGPGSGTVTGTGTSGTLPIWNGSSMLANSLLSQVGTVVSVSGQLSISNSILPSLIAVNTGSSNIAEFWSGATPTIKSYINNAGEFISPGGVAYAYITGSNATGTWPISISGNAATATNSNQWSGLTYAGGAYGSAPTFVLGFDGTNWRSTTAAGLQSFLGLNTSNWVDLTSAQTISGRKTLTNRLDVVGTGTTNSTVGFTVDPLGGGVDNFVVWDGGQVYMRGNVGIGTTSPGAALDVNGDAYVRSVLAANTIDTYSGTTITLNQNTTLGSHSLTAGAISGTTGTFTGNITINSVSDAINVLNRNSVSDNALTQYKTNGTLNWRLGVGITDVYGNNTDFHLYNETGGYDFMTVYNSDASVEFAGNVSVAKMNFGAGLKGNLALNNLVNYNISASDFVVFCDRGGSGSNQTVNLPAVSNSTYKTIYTIKNMNAALTVTIAANGSDLIDGSSTYVLATQYEAVTIISMQVGYAYQWLVLSKF